MTAVLGALLPVFMLIVAGVALKRTLLADDNGWRSLEQLTYFVLTPALFLETIRRANLAEVPIFGLGGALIISVLLMAGLCLALWPLLSRRFGVTGPAFTSIFQGAARWQIFITLSVAGNLLGNQGLALASVGMVALVPLLNVMCVSVLAHFASPGKTRWQDVLLAVVKNPFIWSCVAGFILNVVQLPIPQFIVAFLDALGRAALAIGLLVVGAGLHLEGLLRPRLEAWLATGLKLLVMPVFMISLSYAFGLRGPELVIAAICSSVPTASAAYVLARHMGGDAPLMAQIVTIQTVVAALTMPIVIVFAASL